MPYNFVPGRAMTGKTRCCPVCECPQAQEHDYRLWSCPQCRRLLYSHYSFLDRYTEGRWRLWVDRFDTTLHGWLVLGMVGSLVAVRLPRPFTLAPLYICSTLGIVLATTILIEGFTALVTRIAGKAPFAKRGRAAMFKGAFGVAVGLILTGAGVMALHATANIDAILSAERGQGFVTQKPGDARHPHMPTAAPRKVLP